MDEHVDRMIRSITITYIAIMLFVLCYGVVISYDLIFGSGTEYSREDKIGVFVVGLGGTFVYLLSLGWLSVFKSRRR